jgi:hypothetical protein
MTFGYANDTRVGKAGVHGYRGKWYEYMGFPVLSYFHKTINDHGSFTFHLLLLSLYIRIVCECFMFTGYDDRELRLKKKIASPVC